MTHVPFGSLRAGHNHVTVLCGNCKAPMTMPPGKFKFRKANSKGQPLACSRKCVGALQAKRAREADVTHSR
jgi:hypothetical protein